MPYLGKRIKLLKPRIEDVLLEFYKPESRIIYLDIGANSGQTIDFVNKVFHYSTIYSFEPTQSLVVQLKQKYNNTKNVHIFDIAISDDDKLLDFYQSNYSPTNSCLEPNTSLYNKFSQELAGILEKSKKFKVEGKKLDSWYNQNLNDEIIDIVKIDTQGSEYNVIKGGLNTLTDKVKLLYFEIQYHDFYKNSVPFYKTFELLYENGFYYYCHLASSKRDKYQILESDVLFVNKRFIPPFK